MEEATEPQMKALGVSIQPSSRPANLSDSSGANPSRLHIPSPRLLPMHGKAGKKVRQPLCRIRALQNRS